MEIKVAARVDTVNSYMEFSFQKMGGSEPDIVFYIPVPHLDMDEPTLGNVKKSFSDEGLNVRVVGVDQYACAACWVEIALSAAKFTGICIATHYCDKILDGVDLAARKRLDDLVSKVFDALRQSVRSKYDQFCISFRIGGAGTEIHISRRNEEEARRIIRNTFFELRNKLDRPEGKIYWIDTACHPDEGPISVKVTHWNAVMVSASRSSRSTNRIVWQESSGSGGGFLALAS